MHYADAVDKRGGVRITDEAERAKIDGARSNYTRRLPVYVGMHAIVTVNRVSA